MSEKDLRTKIADLPLCKDKELIDTLIAIGKDGKTYRVDSADVITGESSNSSVDCIPIAYRKRDEGIAIQWDDNPDIDIKELLTLGGVLHIVVNVAYTTLDIPILFDPDCMFQYTTYDEQPVYMVESGTVFVKKIIEKEGAYGNEKTTYFKPEIVHIYSTIYVANINNPDRVMVFNITIKDIDTFEVDKDTKFVVTNLFFEPRRMPSSRLVTTPISPE